MTDIFFLKYPSEVGLVIKEREKILYPNHVFFSCRADGACTLIDPDDNQYVYSSGKNLILTTPSTIHENLPLDIFLTYK